MDEIKKMIRDVPDFPKKGILFKDITPILQSGEAFHKVIDTLVQRYQGTQIDQIVGIESRGFIFGATLAYALKKGFVPVRKVGKLPWKTVSHTYDLEYGTDTIQMHQDAIRPGDRVVIVDDLLATGGTAQATANLVQQMGGKVAELCFIVELGFLEGKDRLKGMEIFSLIQCE